MSAAEASTTEPAEQSGPIVVYGATGYTGRLVSAELARRGATFTVAGRSAAKLAALADSLDTAPEVAAVPIDDAAGLRALLDGAGAVIACAGPFVEHGGPVVAAAAETGTHYVDTTGEQPFIRSVFDRWGPIAQSAARRSSAAWASTTCRVICSLR